MYESVSLTVTHIDLIHDLKYNSVKITIVAEINYN